MPRIGVGIGIPFRHGGGVNWLQYWTPLINAWQNAGSDVYVAGCDDVPWASSGSAPASPAAQTDVYTYINPGLAIRQKGYITSIKLHVYYLYNGGDIWEFKLFFWNGTEYECKASQAFTPVGDAVVSNWQTFTLDPPMLAVEGDIPGVYIPLKNSMFPGPDPINADKYLPKSGFIKSNIAIGESDVFTEKITDYLLLKLKCYSHRPYAAFIGDSIFSSGNGYGFPTDGREWHTDQENAGADDVHTPGGATDGDINLSVPYRVSTRMPSNFRYQNFAKGGTTSTTMAARRHNAVLADPKKVFIHCGVNDIAGAITWTTGKDNLDSLIASFPVGTEFYLDEILPRIIDTKASADIAVARNAEYKTYCTNNGWTLVECYQPMGVWDVDHYVLNPLYSNTDNVHLNLAGADKLADIIASYFNL
jgi:hypothetical protein